MKGKQALPYNVANPAGELSVLELAELLVGLFPDKKLVVDRQPSQAEGSYLASTFNRLVPDVSRLKTLGWYAEVTPAQGFFRMIEAFNLRKGDTSELN